MDKLSIILPVYNEASTIWSVLEQVLAQETQLSLRQIVVVESNSSDGTRELVQKFAATAAVPAHVQIKLILEDSPRGKGHAVRRGLEAATGDIVLIQDGDLEYDFREYPILLQPILDGKTKFVLGSRHMAAESWRIRKFNTGFFGATIMNVGGVLFHRLFNLIYRQTLTDPTTMFKVFERRAAERLHFTSNRFDFDYELVGKMIRAGHRPLEVPVSYNSRGFEAGKKIDVWRDPWTWVVAILWHRFSRLYVAAESLEGKCQEVIT